eukprot:2501933-Rhodomonas_salina.2
MDAPVVSGAKARWIEEWEGEREAREKMGTMRDQWGTHRRTKPPVQTAGAVPDGSNVGTVFKTDRKIQDRDLCRTVQQFAASGTTPAEICTETAHGSASWRTISSGTAQQLSSQPADTPLLNFPIRRYFILVFFLEAVTNAVVYPTS